MELQLPTWISWRERDEMTSFRKLAAPVTCVAVICGAAILASRATGDLKGDSVTALGSIVEKMTPEQIAEAERLAGEWKPRALPTGAGSRGDF
jgi:hypothetical protein